MHKSKFWPLDYDPEGEIYETLAWDLPGFRQPLPSGRTGSVRPLHKRKIKQR